MKDSVVTFLKNRKHKFCVLATADATGQPHASTMKYASMDDGTIVLTTHKGTGKWNNLAQNPHVALVFGADFEDLYVQMKGTARIVDKTGDGKQYMEFFCAIHPFAAEVSDNPDVIFIAVSPSWIRVTDFSLQPLNVKEMTL